MKSTAIQPNVFSTWQCKHKVDRIAAVAQAFGEQMAKGRLANPRRTENLDNHAALNAAYWRDFKLGDAERFKSTAALVVGFRVNAAFTFPASAAQVRLSSRSACRPNRSCWDGSARVNTDENLVSWAASRCSSRAN